MGFLRPANGMWIQTKIGDVETTDDTWRGTTNGVQPPTGRAVIIGLESMRIALG